MSEVSRRRLVWLHFQGGCLALDADDVVAFAADEQPGEGGSLAARFGFGQESMPRYLRLRGERLVAAHAAVEIVELARSDIWTLPTFLDAAWPAGWVRHLARHGEGIAPVIAPTVVDGEPPRAHPP